MYQKKSDAALFSCNIEEKVKWSVQ